MQSTINVLGIFSKIVTVYPNTFPAFVEAALLKE